jgi:3D (Asp-Asp-Asp) domain-containing protein
MKTFDKCVMLLSLALLFILFAVLAYREKPRVYTDFSIHDFYVPRLPRTLETDKPTEKIFCFSLKFHENMQTTIDEMLVTYYDMEIEYLGTYFVTAYCPAECGGSWQTSSGATCHRADWENRYTEPTTVAIDLRVGSYGDTYYIPEFDRVFVAEDTGPGVQGHWIDVFYEDYEDVLSFPTGSYPVYKVIDITEYTILGTDENLEKYGI